MISGIPEVQMTYGNALSNTMMVNRITQKSIDHMKLFIMKHVVMNKMQGREKNTLKLVWENVI